MLLMTHKIRLLRYFSFLSLHLKCIYSTLSLSRKPHLFSANLEEGDFVENYRCVYESYHTAQGLWLLNVNRPTQLAELSHIH